MQPAPRPLPVPDAQALAALPLPIRACAECGSPGVRPLRLDEGGVPGVSEVLDKMACPRCGHQGLAIEFRAREDYADFLAAQAPAE